MEIFVVAAVIVSAMMHAGWNAMLRFKGDRIALMTMLAAGSGIIALPAIFFVEPPHMEAWPWIGASMAMHLGYNLFLAVAYGHGELGRIYPVARGTAPLLTLGVSLIFLDEALTTGMIAGILVLGLGIVSLGLEDGVRALRRNPAGLGFALITAVFIACYTLADGVGARVADNPHGYVVWLFVLNALPLSILLVVRQRRGALDVVRRNWKAGIVAGGLSLGAYWVAIWAFTVAPIALVAALRETSVVFAIGIGVLFLGERLRLMRIVAVVLVVAGLILMRL